MSRLTFDPSTGSGQAGRGKPFLQENIAERKEHSAERKRKYFSLCARCYLT